MIRGIALPLPYAAEDIELIRCSDQIEASFKLDFAEDQPSSHLCVSNAQPSDSAYHMRIKCSYQLQSKAGLLSGEVWVTNGTQTHLHKRLCQMSSFADYIVGRDNEYTLLQPHRFIAKSVYRDAEVFTKNYYTSCHNSSCGGCAS